MGILQPVPRRLPMASCLVKRDDAINPTGYRFFGVPLMRRRVRITTVHPPMVL